MTKSFWTTDRIIAETQHRCVLLMQAHVVPGLWDDEVKGPARGYYDSLVDFARLAIANMYSSFGGMKGKATIDYPGFPAPPIRDWVDFLPPAPPRPTSKALGELDRWLDSGAWVDPVRQGEPYDIERVVELAAWAREIGVPIGEPTLEKAADGEFDLWEDADGDFEEAVGGTYARAIVAMWLVKHGYLAENDIQWLTEGWTVSREPGLGGKILLYPPHLTHTAWALVELALRHMTGSWPWSNNA